MRLAGMATLMAVLATLATPAAAQSLDYELFKTRVEPIFLHKRQGLARCYSCHSQGTPLRLQRLSPGSTNWNEEQSRKNFEAVQRVVAPGDPQASRLLMHPLAAEAGGDPFHSGGKHWTSQNDPEWQTLAAWVKTGGAATSAASTLDFQFYRTRVEPMFLKPRPNTGAHLACYTCHSVVATRLRLEPLAVGAAAWTEEQSRRNFRAVASLVAPGEPLQSRLLLQPLATEAGGTEAHTGGKFFASQSDPEWQTLAAWVRTGKPGTGAAAAPVTLDFEFFRTRVQPVFLHKRKGLARCYSCHSQGTPLRLQRLSAGVTAWNEEQSRKNFEAVQRVVAPGDPQASRLLMHPLAAEAGGDPFHSGGKHWTSQSDPEWQTLADWVRGKK